MSHNRGSVNLSTWGGGAFFILSVFNAQRCSGVTLPFATVLPAVEHYILTHATFCIIEICASQLKHILFLSILLLFLLITDCKYIDGSRAVVV